VNSRYWPLLVALSMFMACHVERQPVGASVAVSAPWSRAVALSVLRRAVASEDDGLRAEAWRRWLQSGDPSVNALQARAVMDPSPLVQRSLARHHTGQVGAALASRSGADPVALAWLALRGREVSAPEGPFWAALFPALGGDSAAQTLLLQHLREGPEVLDPELVEVLRASGITGMAEALMTGAQHAEAGLAEEMQLAALGLGDIRAAETLLDVDAPLQLTVWAVEVAVLHPSHASTERLKRLARASDNPVSLHARLALMALRQGLGAEALEGLKHRDRDTRAWAATCLRYSRSDRTVLRDEIALLQGSTRDESRRVRVESVKTLVALVGVEAVPVKPPSDGQDPTYVDTILASEWLLQADSSVRP